MRKLTLLQPFLFAVFPILSLFSSNLYIMEGREIVAPLAIVICATGLLLLVGVAVLRDREGAAAIVSVFWLLFFSYAHVLKAIGGPGGWREGFLLLAWVLLFGGAGYGVVRWRGRLQNLASILSVVGIALVAMPLASMAPALLSERRARTAYEAPATLPEQTPRSDASLRQRTRDAASATSSPTATPHPQAPEAATEPLTQAPQRPNIYYIILDGYGRADVLEEVYQYDNSEFVAALTSRGFFVASRSRANYGQTYLSLASSLNSTYLGDLAERMGETSDDRRPLQEMVRNNTVTAILKQEGYTYVTFSTGYAEGELAAADVHNTAPRSLTQFQSGLVNTAPISPVIQFQYDMHRERLLYAFEHLPDTAQMEPPVFVLAHLTTPHPPFVFDENGEPVTPDKEFTFSDGSHYIGGASREEYVRSYVRQLHFVNGKVIALIDNVLASSPEPPVIILQSDHGPGSRLDWDSLENTYLKERMSILNAYYLPGGGATLLYDEITPVNSFRVIFNHYFGAHYALLDDESYFSLWNQPYGFIPVPAE